MNKLLVLVVACSGLWMSEGNCVAEVPPTLDQLKEQLEGQHTAAEHSPQSSTFSFVIAQLQEFFGVHLVDVPASNANRRVQELLNTSEGPCPSRCEWDRHIWLPPDTSAHPTPERVHGGIQ